METAFLRPEDVAELVGLDVDTLAQLRYRGTGPRFYKPTPRKVLYKREEVLEWIEATATTKTGALAGA